MVRQENCSNCQPWWILHLLVPRRDIRRPYHRGLLGPHESLRPEEERESCFARQASNRLLRDQGLGFETPMGFHEGQDTHANLA